MQRDRQGTGRRGVWAVLLTAAMFGLAVAWLLLRSIHQGHAHSFDTLLYARSLWGLAHGEPFNPVANTHALAIHGHFGLWLMVPWAWFAPAADVLAWAQAAALFVTLACAGLAALGTWQGPAGWQQVALGVGVLLAAALGTPLVLNPFLFDVRPDLLGVPLCTVALLRVERRDNLDWGAVALFAAALLCREELAMLAVASAATLPGPRALRSALGLGAGGYWLLYWFVLRGAIGGDFAESRVADSADVLMGTATFGLALLLSKLEIVATSLLGMGALAVRGGRFALPALPGVLMLLAQNRRADDVLNYHYGMFAAPALIAAGVRGLRRTQQPKTGASRAGWREVALGSVAVMTCWLWSSAAPGGARFQASAFAWPGARPPTAFAPSAQLEQAHRMLAAVPSAARIATHFAFGGELADRLLPLSSAQLPENPQRARDIELAVLVYSDWPKLGRYLVERENFVLWDATPGTLAILGRSAPPMPPKHLMRTRTDCSAPPGSWPEAGIVLCEAGRFLDGRLAVVLRRTGTGSIPARVPLRVGIAGAQWGSEFLGLSGLLTPQQMPVGATIRMLSPGPAHGFAAEIFMEAEGSHRLAARAGEADSAAAIPVKIDAAPR